MAEHLTLVTLRRALSSRAGVSEKVADDFLSALTGSIQEGLQKDGNVTISGLGTFKLQDVPARESVNVATGERFTIAGYKKIVFGTDTRRSGKTADEPIDPIRKLGEQAEEIKDILNELGAMPTDMPATEHVDIPIEPVIEPIVTPAPAPEPSVAPEPTPAPTEPTGKTEEAPTESTQKMKKQSKPFNAWLTGLITIGVFAMLLIIAYFVLRHQIVSWADGMRTTIEQRVNTEPTAQPSETPTATPEAFTPSESSEPAETPANATSTETAAPATTAEAKPAAPDYFDDSQRTFTDFQPVETVAQDSRLAWIAKKRYGDKAYWVFIYEANRDKLSTPDRVLPGMQLRIPELPAELRNANDPKTQALLKRLSNKYLK
ncbi:MAG: HU family DNA-binding protein [Paludibacteraceae bacterium]|nr:HU family DNA-binding protein [Paludibacteraceae bacterium]